MMMTLPKERSFSWMAKLEYSGISDCFAITDDDNDDDFANRRMF